MKLLEKIQDFNKRELYWHSHDLIYRYVTRHYGQDIANDLRRKETDYLYRYCAGLKGYKSITLEQRWASRKRAANWLLNKFKKYYVKNI